MSDSRIGGNFQRLCAALDNLQESYEMLRAGVFADEEICKDLLLQLESARSATEAWREFMEAGGISH